VKTQNKYYVDKKSLVKEMKMKILERFLEVNYSNKDARVYRYMRRVGLTNYDEVVHKCVLFDNDARKILYNLHLNGFIFQK
jgi:hypothetical protein